MRFEVNFGFLSSLIWIGGIFGAVDAGVAWWWAWAWPLIVGHEAVAHFLSSFRP